MVLDHLQSCSLPYGLLQFNAAKLPPLSCARGTSGRWADSEWFSMLATLAGVIYTESIDLFLVYFRFLQERLPILALICIRSGSQVVLGASSTGAGSACGVPGENSGCVFSSALKCLELVGIQCCETPSSGWIGSSPEAQEDERSGRLTLFIRVALCRCLRELHVLFIYTGLFA